MAPELIKGNKNIIPIKCDVYSYGIFICLFFDNIHTIKGITILQCYLGCTWASMKCFNEIDGKN